MDQADKYCQIIRAGRSSICLVIRYIEALPPISLIRLEGQRKARFHFSPLLLWA